jgi:hypothetical protein
LCIAIRFPAVRSFRTETASERTENDTGTVYIAGVIDGNLIGGISAKVVAPLLPSIVIEKTEDTYQGQHEYVSVTLEDNPVEMGGFDLLIAYDASALIPMEITPGQLLEDCDWE